MDHDMSWRMRIVMKIFLLLATENLDLRTIPTINLSYFLAMGFPLCTERTGQKQQFLKYLPEKLSSLVKQM